MNNKLPNRIRELRKRNNMSGAEVSSKLRISTQYLYDIEKGKRTLSADMASKLSEIFNTTTDYLLRKTDINLYDWIPSPAEEAEQEKLKNSPSYKNEKEFLKNHLTCQMNRLKINFRSQSMVANFRKKSFNACLLLFELNVFIESGTLDDPPKIIGIFVHYNTQS
ncbi:helix-turn-helix transcriptional regulator [Paenibacillus larvae]|nr:helix-turn-helix transcriptional regulator [Paenibacillus larvae]MDT2237673.1 helix-turn-helix transcriptional regulator [Paenibacillus larvae]MDT2249483.1 helix-turn-helix transcriptional regulator [Paenibacillus larvae]MDT2261608.1 helix-turn-helix transcriptional regulator [Paenibacillus larvae]MDT2288713.1 helix-turn-helix transcriptional regulator [Paenibacillus larvae]MDT2306838.1 helix-turn-helix transcriptional regulator [Paenibacillus larvae]